MLKSLPVEEAEYAGRPGTSRGLRRPIVAAMLGALAVGAAWMITAMAQTSPRPIREGYGTGSITVREKNYTTELKCKDCKVECFDRFIVVHADKAKEPTWTGNYLVVIPWEKVDSMTLSPQPSGK